MSIQAPSIAIPENSTFLKVISALPLVGAPISKYQQASLEAEILDTSELSKKAQLNRIKSEYHKIDMVRHLLTVACIVAGIAFSFISTSVVFGGIFILNLKNEVEEINTTTVLRIITGIFLSIIGGPLFLNGVAVAFHLEFAQRSYYLSQIGRE